MAEEPIVYLIDDDQAILESLRALVEALNLRAECHTSAQTFLERVDRSRPGCAVVDLRMPGLSGIELQQVLAERGIPLPIIIFTAHGDVEQEARALNRGAIRFLEKPCRSNVLAAAIREALAVGVERHKQRVTGST